MGGMADVADGLCLPATWGSKGGHREHNQQGVPPFKTGLQR